MGLNLEVRVRPVGGNRLAEDYARGDAALAPFFAGSPFDPEAYRRKAGETRNRFDSAQLEAMAGAVRPLSPDAERKLAAAAAGEGFFVTTGQQPGLFGGPLFTIHKALSAIALAGRLEQVLDAPVLPLFWIASDDHDWAEANHVHILDTANALHRLELELGPEAPVSMGRLALEGRAENALDKLAQLLPPSEYTDPILARLGSEWGRDAGTTVAGAFTATIAALFDGLSLGLVDGQDPRVRTLGSPVIRKELENAASHERALAEQTARLREAGYEAQVPILDGAANVFIEDDSGRERLMREAGGWILRASGRQLSDDDVRELLEQSPDRFSPNVVLRPVVESSVFPTLAYVGGPGEVRYLAQTGCLFERHGVGMPLVFPRLGVTLVESKVRKVLDKFGLDVDAFPRPMHEVVSQAVRDEVPEPVEVAVEELRRSLQAGYGAVYEAAEPIDPTLKGPIFNARNEGFKAISEIEKKIRQHVKLKQETELDQLAKVAVNLGPEMKPQERVLNVHQYLARYGPDLIPGILERMTIELNGDGSGWAGVRCD